MKLSRNNILLLTGLVTASAIICGTLFVETSCITAIDEPVCEKANDNPLSEVGPRCSIELPYKKCTSIWDNIMQ